MTTAAPLARPAVRPESPLRYRFHTPNSVPSKYIRTVVLVTGTPIRAADLVTVTAHGVDVMAKACAVRQHRQSNMNMISANKVSLPPGIVSQQFIPRVNN